MASFSDFLKYAKFISNVYFQASKARAFITDIFQATNEGIQMEAQENKGIKPYKVDWYLFFKQVSGMQERKQKKFKSVFNAVLSILIQLI